jgi:nitric oxide reductase NorE protein
VHLARQGPSPWIRRLIFAAMTTGILFFINKIIEYSEKISADITLFTNDFFLYYYMITGLHMLHVLVGTGILLYLYNRLNKRILLDSDQEALTNGGAVWHMVDLLWIVLFALIYLIK